MRLPSLLAAVALSVLAAGCMATPGAPPAPSAVHLPAPPGEPPSIQVEVDSVRRLVIMTAGPFRIPPSHGGMLPGGHAEHPETSPLLPFRWPVDGWYRGFRVRAIDAEGAPLPDGLLHHVIGVNLGRRQVVYPVAERFFGVGTETGDILLPEQFGVPMDEAGPLAVYASWQNETGAPVDGVYLQVALAYTPADARDDVEAVVPIYIDAHNVIGETNSFDLPPGASTHSYEFEVPVDGALLGLSGHLHDHGRSVRLEDAETGKVLVELDAIRNEAGRVVGIERRIFRRLFGLLDARIPLEKGRRYRVVGRYFNPEDRAIEDGGMAHLSGIFAPAHFEGWTELDDSSETYRRDVGALPPPLAVEAVRPVDVTP